MTTHRERALGQARADLVALPDLAKERDRARGERHHDVTGYKGKVVGSPSPADLPAVHLADTRRKPFWDDDDPEITHAFKRYGITPGLELWVKKLAFALPEWPDLTETATVRSECAVLLENWNFICEQSWAETLARQVRGLIGQIKAELGMPKEQRYLCPECHNPAYIVPGGILSCIEGHERVVRDLEQELRRRPMATTTEIVDEFGEHYGVTAGLLRQWKLRRKLKPAREENHGNRTTNWWWPWDVFCLLNPDIADAIRLRDEALEGDQTSASVTPINGRTLSTAEQTPATAANGPGA